MKTHNALSDKGKGGKYMKKIIIIISIIAGIAVITGAVAGAVIYNKNNPSFNAKSEAEIKQFFYENKEIFEDVKDKVWDNKIKKDEKKPIPEEIEEEYESKVPFPEPSVTMCNYIHKRKGTYKFLDFSFFYRGNNCRANIIYSERNIVDEDYFFFRCEKLDENWYYEFEPLN